MMRIEDGEIIPSVGIGDYTIGMEKKLLKKKLGKDFSERKQGGGRSVIALENAKIWFDSRGLSVQIGVTKGFKGSYQQNVKIGTTLKEIVKAYGKYEYIEYTYNIVGVDGICFELEEPDDWDEIENMDELTLPIEWIYVYKI